MTKELPRRKQKRVLPEGNYRMADFSLHNFRKNYVSKILNFNFRCQAIFFMIFFEF